MTPKALKFKPGDLVKILPPEGINDTSDHRKAYEKNYKGHLFEVIRSGTKMVQIASNHTVEAEEVTIRINGLSLDPTSPASLSASSEAGEGHIVPGRALCFFAWSLRLHDGLEAIFDWLDKEPEPVV